MASGSHQTRNTLGSRFDAFRADPSNLTIVGLDTDHGKGTHPLWDERAMWPVDENLVRNIMVHGVLESITVQKDGEKFLVVIGRQRVKAAREANIRLKKEGKELVTIPVMPPRKGTDADMFGVMISENEIRKDDDYRTKAEKALRAINMGKSDAEVAILFGVTTASVKNWLAFFDLCPRAQKEIEKGRISPTAAGRLAKLSKEDQEKQLDELLEGVGDDERVTVRKAAGAKASKESDGEATAAPRKRLLVKIVEHDDAKETLGADFINGIRFAIGLLKAERVKGLTGMISELQPASDGMSAAKKKATKGGELYQASDDDEAA